MSVAPLHVVRRGDGPPLILLHGFFSDHRLWAPVVDALAASHHCVSVDLPGHGRSATWRGAWTDLLDQLDALVEACSAPVSVVGYSLGARVLGQLLQRRGAPIDAAVLISANPGFASFAAEQRRQRDEELGARMRAFPLQQTVDEWAAQPIFEGQDRAPTPALERQRALRLDQSPDGLAFALTRFGAGTASIERAPTRGRRIVLMSGDRLEIDRARARALASRWPDAELSWLEGCGHNPIIEAPERLNARLRQLLQTTH